MSHLALSGAPELLLLGKLKPDDTGLSGFLQR